MIVKISTTAGWRFIDKVEDVFIHQDSGDNIAAQGNNCPTEWMDNDKNLPIDLGKSYKVITIHKDGELFKRIVVKENIIYLLNDAGKTIERLN